MLARLRGWFAHWFAHMRQSWQPRPEHRAEQARVERIEASAEKLGVSRKDALELRLQVIQRGREGR